MCESWVQWATERPRGPAGAAIGTLKRVIISNITSYNSSPLPSIIAGIDGHPVEDVKISDVFIQQVGGGSSELAGRQPPDEEATYPEPTMFGELPASGFFIRHARNVEMSNVEIQTVSADARPACWLQNVEGADFFFPCASRQGAPTRSIGWPSSVRSVLDRCRMSASMISNHGPSESP
jgi:hypothetical protein